MPLRIRSILAANDRSDAADSLIQAAAALSELTEADLHVVHALEPSSLRIEVDAEFSGLEAKLEEAREDQRQQLRYSIPPTVLVESCEVEFGPPHAVILQRALQVAADLIIIGPHRRRDLPDKALGSTADRIIRMSEVPCLIVRGPLSLPLRRILVPTDLSPGAQRALEIALTWGTALRMPTQRGGGTEVCVLHVMPPHAANATVTSEQEVDVRVSSALEVTGIGRLLSIDRQIREGESPTDEILRVAEKGNVDLVVLGTHGRTALARALIGSVSSNVARRAEVPVLLVPPVLSPS